MIALLMALQAAPDTIPVVRTTIVTAPSAPLDGGGTLLGCFWQTSPDVQKLDGFAIFLPEGWESGRFDPANLHDPSGFLKGDRFQRVAKDRSVVKFSSIQNTLTVTPEGGGLFSAILVTGKESRGGTCQAGDLENREAAFSFFDGLRGRINEPGERG